MPLFITMSPDQFCKGVFFYNNKEDVCHQRCKHLRLVLLF